MDEPNTKYLDFSTLPQGRTYEDQYQGYLRLFEDIARTPPDIAIQVKGPPWSWVPLLHYLRCLPIAPRTFFRHDEAARGAVVVARAASPNCMDRTFVEVMCGFRPECVDALWKCDMQWKTERAKGYENDGVEFVVTNNGSFHRREVNAFTEVLREYVPKKRNVVLVPCAADKPYPAPLHRAILAFLPDSYYLCNVTGVLGLVPQDLWDHMPHYDSGIPNRWRVLEAVKWYFRKFSHEKIVVYCDFYVEAISIGLDMAAQSATFMVPVEFHADYLDLLDEGRLLSLRRVL